MKRLKVGIGGEANRISLFYEVGTCDLYILFYEVGTCDLYIRSLFQGQDVKIKDILGLSIGMKFYMK